MPFTSRPSEELELALAASAYVPLLSIEADSAVVSLARQLRIGGEQTITGVVWTQRFDDRRDAESRCAWLASKAQHLTEWGRVAAIIGPDALTARLATEWQAEVRRLEKRREQEEEEAREAETIWLLLDEVGHLKRPAILMRQGDYRAEPFLTIKLREGWEQDRIYDWARWQTGHYREWKEHCDEHGPKSLERLIMTEMLKTENAVKKAGLGSGGRRPLRFWRGEQA